MVDFLVRGYGSVIESEAGDPPRVSKLVRGLDMDDVMFAMVEDGSSMDLCDCTFLTIAEVSRFLS